MCFVEIHEGCIVCDNGVEIHIFFAFDVVVFVHDETEGFVGLAADFGLAAGVDFEDFVVIFVLFNDGFQGFFDFADAVALFLGFGGFFGEDGG